MTAVVFDDAPTQALTSLYVCVKKACDELKNSDATLDDSEFKVSGGKRKRDDDKDVKLIDMMRLTKRRLRGLINGSIPLVDPGVKTPAKKQMEHMLKDVKAYLGDLPYDYEESDDDDLPFKVADSDDDSDDKEEEEEGEEEEEEDDDAKEEADDGDGDGDGDADASDKDDAEYEEKEEEEEADEKDSSEEEDAEEEDAEEEDAEEEDAEEEDAEEKED